MIRFSGILRANLLKFDGFFEERAFVYLYILFFFCYPNEFFFASFRFHLVISIVWYGMFVWIRTCSDPLKVHISRFGSLFDCLRGVCWTRQTGANNRWTWNSIKCAPWQHLLKYLTRLKYNPIVKQSHRPPFQMTNRLKPKHKTQNSKHRMVRGFFAFAQPKPIGYATECAFVVTLFSFFYLMLCVCAVFFFFVQLLCCANGNFDAEALIKPQRRKLIRKEGVFKIAP